MAQETVAELIASSVERETHSQRRRERERAGRREIQRAEIGEALRNERASDLEYFPFFFFFLLFFFRYSGESVGGRAGHLAF
jgi:hypothetical protein